MGWDLTILVPSHICKWNEKTSHSRPYICFGIKICSDPVPKEMGSRQLKIFSFWVANETDGTKFANLTPAMCTVYASEIKKKVSLPFLNFFMGQKYVSTSSQMGWDPAGSHRGIPFHQEKLTSLPWTNEIKKSNIKIILLLIKFKIE